MRGNNLKCFRCGRPMDYIMTEDIQLGKHGFLLGDFTHLLAGGLEVAIYACTGCGKIELFRANGPKEELPQRKCPECGKEHDFDYPKCPFCKHRY